MRARAHFTPSARSSYAQSVPGPPPRVDCSLGVNPYGPPPALRDVAVTGAELADYPPPDGAPLREAVARYWSDVAALGPENVVLHTGSMGVLQLAGRLVLDPGDEVLGPSPMFADYKYDVEAAGGVYRPVLLRPERGFAFDAGAFVAAIRPCHKLVYIDNPNNPTGQAIPPAALRRVAQAARENDSLLVVDEAYGDFLPPEDSAVALVPEFPNLLVARSFSKGFGLAGIRAGYGVAREELIQNLRAVDTIFVLGTPALVFAQRALEHRAYVADTARRIASDKARIQDGLTWLRCAATHPGVPILLLWAEAPGSLKERFARRGVRVGAPLEGLDERYARLRVPPPHQMDDLLEALAAVEAQLRREAAGENT